MNIYISLIITMVFSAFFSGVEIAFVSVDKLRFEMERKGGITSRILSIFFKNPNEFISTMLVGNNIALVIYGILMAQIIGDNLLAGFIDNHFLMVLAQTVISTLIILVTGEFLPKTIFKINPNLVLNVFAIPLIICYVILYPISKLASGLSCLFLRVFGMKINKDASDRAFGKVDLDYFVQSSIDNAENEEELDTEVKIFQNALDFSNIKIRDCIVPRTEVVAVDLTTSLDELKSGAYGIPEPSSGAPEIPPDGISLVIVPALSCDRNGYRLGYGGGYYDRFLARTRAVAAALCAESRLTDELPREPFDLPCNYIITERQVLHTNEK